MTDRQPQTAWLDTPFSGEATKTKTELRGLEERNGGEKADKRSFSSEEMRGEKESQDSKSKR